MKKNNAYVALFLTLATVIAHGCMTTIFNDNSGPVLVIDHVHESNKDNLSHPGLIVSIPRNKQRRIGKADEHANFTVYTKQAKSQQFVATYHVVQNECGANGNPIVKMSDLAHGTGNTNLFTVTKLGSEQSSAVKELSTAQSPDIFKTEQPAYHGCSACNALHQK